MFESTTWQRGSLSDDRSQGMNSLLHESMLEVQMQHF